MTTGAGGFAEPLFHKGPMGRISSIDVNNKKVELRHKQCRSAAFSCYNMGMTPNSSGGMIDVGNGSITRFVDKIYTS
jgi:hypothetical protein